MTTRPEKERENVFLLLVAQIQIEEAVIADQLCRSSRLRLTLGESSAIQTKLPANALHTDPKKIIIIFFLFWNQILNQNLHRLNSFNVKKDYLCTFCLVWSYDEIHINQFSVLFKESFSANPHSFVHGRLTFVSRKKNIFWPIMKMLFPEINFCCMFQTDHHFVGIVDRPEKKLELKLLPFFSSIKQVPLNHSWYCELPLLFNFCFL